MIGDTSERVDIDIARDWWVRRNDRVECKGDYCLFWRLEWVRAYQRVCYSRVILIISILNSFFLILFVKLFVSHGDR